MIDPTPQVRKLAEAELYRAELEARRLARRLFLVGIAVFIAFFALVMLVIAGFLYLAELYGYPLGALITGGSLVLLAFIALVFAGREPGRADKLELELANRAIAEARADVKREFDAIERTLNDLTLGILGLVKGSSSSLPLITIIIGALAALTGDPAILAELIADDRAKRDRVVTRLNQISGVTCDTTDDVSRKSLSTGGSEFRSWFANVLNSASGPSLPRKKPTWKSDGSGRTVMATPTGQPSSWWMRSRSVSSDRFAPTCSANAQASSVLNFNCS